MIPTRPDVTCRKDSKDRSAAAVSFHQAQSFCKMCFCCLYHGVACRAGLPSKRLAIRASIISWDADNSRRALGSFFKPPVRQVAFERLWLCRVVSRWWSSDKNTKAVGTM